MPASSQQSYQHNGWIVSPYSQKTLAYFKYKGIPHEDVTPNGLDLALKITKKTGKAIMPTVVTPEGAWLQDSAEIIDHLEAKFPQHSIEPVTPKQKIAAHLLELHGDEWLILSALHYRWSESESRQFIVGEFGRYAVPFLPGFMRNLVGNHIRKMMMAYMPRFGIVGDTEKGVRIYTESLIGHLEEHFKSHPYLLGNRPCVGDFALYGSMYAHLYRDPGSRPLFDEAPNVAKWIHRLKDADGLAVNNDDAEHNFLPDDEVPETLTPIFKLIFSEQFKFTKGVLKKIDQYVNENPDATRVPRILGDGDFTIGGIKGRRKEFTFVQWKVQRSHDVYLQLSGDQKQGVDQWLNKLGAQDFQSLNIRHRMKRENFKEVLDIR